MPDWIKVDVCADQWETIQTFNILRLFHDLFWPGSSGLFIKEFMIAYKILIFLMDDKYKFNSQCL